MWTRSARHAGFPLGQKQRCFPQRYLRWAHLIEQTAELITGRGELQPDQQLIEYRLVASSGSSDESFIVSEATQQGDAGRWWAARCGRVPTQEMSGLDAAAAVPTKPDMADHFLAGAHYGVVGADDDADHLADEPPGQTVGMGLDVE